MVFWASTGKTSQMMGDLNFADVCSWFSAYTIYFESVSSFNAKRLQQVNYLSPSFRYIELKNKLKIALNWPAEHSLSIYYIPNKSYNTTNMA